MTEHTTDTPKSSKTRDDTLLARRIAALAATGPMGNGLTTAKELRAHQKTLGTLMTGIREELDAGTYKPNKALADQLARHLMEEYIANGNLYAPGDSEAKSAARHILTTHAPGLGLESIIDIAEKYNKDDDRLPVAMCIREATDLVHSTDKAAADPKQLARIEKMADLGGPFSGITRTFKSFVGGASLKDSFEAKDIYATPAYKAYVATSNKKIPENKLREAYRSHQVKNNARICTAFREFRSAFKTAGSHLAKDRVTLPASAQHAGALNTPLP